MQVKDTALHRVRVVPGVSESAFAAYVPASGRATAGGQVAR